MVLSILASTGCDRRADTPSATESTSKPAGATGLQIKDSDAPARADLDRGHLEIRVFGPSADWWSSYATLLQDRLGVQLRIVAGCDVTKQLFDSVTAYNKVMEAEIELRFGKGILDRVKDDARMRGYSPPASVPYTDLPSREKFLKAHRAAWTKCILSVTLQ